MDDIETKVIEIVSEQMGVDKSEITRETHFINDLNADSLDTVELVMAFEDEFELSIPDEEAEKIQTAGQAIDYTTEHSSKSLSVTSCQLPAVAGDESSLATDNWHLATLQDTSRCHHRPWGPHF